MNTSTLDVPAPPGQQLLWPPPAPESRAGGRWWRTVAIRPGAGVYVGPATTSLPLAASAAAAAAADLGEAWVIAEDNTFCHVTATGDVTPKSGWAAVAARVIHRRNHL